MIQSNVPLYSTGLLLLSFFWFIYRVRTISMGEATQFVINPAIDEATMCSKGPSSMNSAFKIACLAWSYEDTAVADTIAVRFTVALTPVQSPVIPSLDTIAWNAWSVCLYSHRFPEGTAIRRIFTTSVGHAIALPIAPEIAPEQIFFQRGVWARSFAPNNSFSGSYKPSLRVLYEASLIKEGVILENKDRKEVQKSAHSDKEGNVVSHQSLIKYNQE